MEAKFKEGQFVSAVVPGYDHLGMIVGEITKVHLSYDEFDSNPEYFYMVDFDALEGQFYLSEDELKSPNDMLLLILAMIVGIIIVLIILSNIK